MSTKKFVASDMRKALKLVREELGADAVILSNRKVAAGIEIVAAGDYDAFVEQHNEKVRKANHIPAFMDDQAEPPTQGDAKRVLREGAASADVKSQLMDALNSVAKLDDEPEVEFSAQARQQYVPDSEVQAPQSAPAPITLQKEAEPRPDSAYQSADPSPELRAMMGEISQLRQMMNAQMANVAWGHFSQYNPLQATVFKKLARLGLSSELCRKLVRNLNSERDMKAAWRDCLLELRDDLPLMQQELTQHGGIFAFVGPAGVGKTTTIAKIATRYVLEHGAENLALVTTDSFRIAGHEQLATLGRILKVPVRVVTEQQSLDQILRGLSRKKLILIDTAGLSHKDEVYSEQMLMLASMGNDIQRWLVLSSTSQRRILDKAVEEYKHLNLDGCIFTKLDESASLGEALSVAIEAQLPIAYTTDGQNIPDDIAQPYASRLINHAVALAKGHSMNDEELADFYGNALTEMEPDVAYG